MKDSFIGRLLVALIKSPECLSRPSTFLERKKEVETLITGYLQTKYGDDIRRTLFNKNGLYLVVVPLIQDDHVPLRSAEFHQYLRDNYDRVVVSHYSPLSRARDEDTVQRWREMDPMVMDTLDRLYRESLIRWWDLSDSEELDFTVYHLPLVQPCYPKWRISPHLEMSVLER